VSLLEVLISVFILSVGLLGVAAIIPAGRLEMADAGKADRSSACAQAILHDVRIRGFLDPRGWRDQGGNPIVKDTSGGAVTAINLNTSYLLQCRTYAIDPTFIAYANSQGITNAERFPYGTAATDMARVTLARALTSNTTLSSAEAERLCTWNDNLFFLIPDEPEDRPRASVLADVGSGATDRIQWPVRSTDGVAGSPQALRDENEGGFTWMLTVTPLGQTTTIAGVDYVSLDESPTYQVSVVVFFRRNMASISAASEQGERTIGTVDFGGVGIGGGDVDLTTSLATDDLDLQQHNWTMVLYAPSGARSKPYEWYRVVATDEQEAGATTRNVTLQGRDWLFGSYNPNAVWFPEVITVFTANIPSEPRG
jgi:hypothetical protein